MKKSLLTKVMALAMAAVMLFSFNTTSQAAAKKNIDTNDTISLWVGDSRTVLIYQDMNMRAPNGTKYRNKARVEVNILCSSIVTVMQDEELDIIWCAEEEREYRT